MSAKLRKIGKLKKKSEENIVKQYVRYLKLERNYSPNTLEAYQHDLLHLQNYCRTEGKALLDISLDDSVAYALRSRKDILADEYTLQQKEEAVKIAEAGKKPSVSLSAGPTISQTFEPSGHNSYDVKAGVSANWNVFDSGVMNAQIDEAKANRDTAKLNLQKAQEDADLAVRTAYYNMREAEHRLDSTADAVGQAEQDAYIAREKYRVGEGILLDVIDARKALSTAKLNHISAQYDYVRYKAQVVNEMGIGLTDEERAAAAKIADTATPAVTAEPQKKEEPAKVQPKETKKDTTAQVEEKAAEESADKVADELAGNADM